MWVYAGESRDLIRVQNQGSYEWEWPAILPLLFRSPLVIHNSNCNYYRVQLALPLGGTYHSGSQNLPNIVPLPVTIIKITSRAVEINHCLNTNYL